MDPSPRGFETAEEALADPIRFMAYAMASATQEDMKALQENVAVDGGPGRND